MRWLVWRSKVVWFDGWWEVSRDRPWLGVAYVRAVLSSSDLWVKCTSSTELEIYSNGCVLGIGQVTVWSSHVEYGAGDLSSWLCIWLLRLFEYILALIIVVMSFIIVIFYWSWHYFSAYHLPAWQGETCWVRLYSHIYCCIFSSRSRLRVWGVWVEGIRIQVDPVGVSYCDIPPLSRDGQS
jgi:hypothetical protein